jgi:hypothetical protein
MPYICMARALAAVLDKTWDAAAISAHRSRSWNDVAAELLEIFESLVSARQRTVHARSSAASFLSTTIRSGRYCAKHGIRIALIKRNSGSNNGTSFAKKGEVSVY